MSSRAYIAAYDIASPRRLRAAHKILLDYAIGRQKSVFECELDDNQRDELCQRMSVLINPDEDRFMLLPASRQRPWLTMGCAPTRHSESFFLFD